MSVTGVVQAAASTTSSPALASITRASRVASVTVNLSAPAPPQSVVPAPIPWMVRSFSPEPSRSSRNSIPAYSMPSVIPRPVIVVSVSVPLLFSQSPESSTHSLSTPSSRPPSRVSGASMSSSRAAVLPTVMRSSPASALTVVTPWTPWTVTVSSPAPAFRVVVPACVLAMVTVSSPPSVFSVSVAKLP